MPCTQKPVSPAQLAANRANAARNSFKHGFTASTFAVVRLEDLQELAGDGDIEITRAQNRNYCLAEGFLRIVRQSNGLTIFLRYQAQAERQYRRALEDFDRLKALRPFLHNEPISALQPQPESATYPTSDTNPFLPENAPPAAFASAADPHPRAAVTSPPPRHPAPHPPAAVTSRPPCRPPFPGGQPRFAGPYY